MQRLQVDALSPGCAKITPQGLEIPVFRYCTQATTNQIVNFLEDFEAYPLAIANPAGPLPRQASHLLVNLANSSSAGSSSW